MIEKTYNASELEGRIYASWEAAGAFRAGRPERRDAAPYSIVIPPPNVTGSLHMGHALNNTLQDVLVRFERMRGRDVLWQPGTDHAGIATQMVVERQLMERQLDRRAMGREAFIKRVWEWKEESGGTIIRQLKRLGASCDWSRERFTMDEGLSRAVLKVFVDLYRAGLIYKDKRLVNWDPKLLTAISDLEVQQVQVRGHLWCFKYPVLGQPDTFITVATTRPETMLGDMAVAVHPNDSRYTEFLGKEVLLPLVDRPIPIIADEHSDPDKGTGAVKVTPAHDFNDFEVWKRYTARMSDMERYRFNEVNNRDLNDLINIFTPEAKIKSSPEDDLDPSKRADWPSSFGPIIQRQTSPESLTRQIFSDFCVAYSIPVELRSLDRFEARKRVVKMMEERGLLEKTEPYTHAVPHGDRSGAVIEPFLTDQWYVDAKALAQEAIEAVRDRHTTFVPEAWEKTYFEWMENIQPWCISRQLWWGHQIPAWYGPDGQHFVAESDEIAHRLAADYYENKDTFQVGPWPLFGANYAEQLRSGMARLKRDEDVLDTWFSSALWPFSTLGWPNETLELKRYYPTNILVTGFDIIFFWVARMMMMGLRFMKEVPFGAVYIHGLVRDERGQKMSKSKGNVIDPLALIDEYGADALRFTLCALAVQGQGRDIRLSSSQVEVYRNFATKLWNTARFMEMNNCVRLEHFDPTQNQQTINRWIVHEAVNAASELTQALKALKFNEAAAAIYRFVWSVFCDWYLELAKPVLAGSNEWHKSETRATAAWAFDQILAMLHPFMPFITEELWGLTGEFGPERRTLLTLSKWPELSNLAPSGDEAKSAVEALIEAVSQMRSVRVSFNIPYKTRLKSIITEFNTANNEVLRANLESIGRLANTEVQFAQSEARIKPGSEFLVRIPVKEGKVVIALPPDFDPAAERIRLEGELTKIEAEIVRFDKKLGNLDFLERAPKDVVEGEREKREEAGSRRAKILEALDRLKVTAFKAAAFHGDSLHRLRGLPENVRRRAGYELYGLQKGADPNEWKHMPTIDPDVREIRIRGVGTYRVIYVALADAIHLLHVFQKKSREISQDDLRIASMRLRQLKEQKMRKPKIFTNVWDALENSPEEAAAMTIRSDVLAAVSHAVREWNTTEAKATRRLDITRARLGDLLRRKINEFPLDTLLVLATRAGIELKI
jgi:valyl-tRNA synthetase